MLDPGDQYWLEAMADAVLILSPVHDRRRYVTDFRVDYANAAAAELAGDAVDDRAEVGALVGEHFLSLEKSAATELLTALREVLLTDVAAAIDGLRYRVPRAGVLTDQVRDVRISKHGERLLVTLRDVTEREHSEQGVRVAR